MRDRIYLDWAPPRDQYHLLSYRARQDSLMQIADELVAVELELGGVTGSFAEKTTASKASLPQASHAAFGEGMLACGPSRSSIPD